MNNDVPFSAASSTLTKFPGAKRIELNATRATMNTTKFRLLTFLYLIQSYPQIKNIHPIAINPYCSIVKQNKVHRIPLVITSLLLK